MMLDNAAATLEYVLAVQVQPSARVETTIEHKGASYKFVIRGGGNAATSKYAITEADIRFAPHFTKLQQIESDPKLWVEDCPAPSPQALAWGQLMLGQLKDSELPPTRVVASAQGGVAFCFLDGKKYADIECLNDGVILGVISNEHDRPVVWEIVPDPDGISQALARIRRFIDPSST